MFKTDEMKEKQAQVLINIWTERRIVTDHIEGVKINNTLDNTAKKTLTDNLKKTLADLDELEKEFRK